MAIVHTEAIVLRSYNLAEADRIVLCLTRNTGLVRGVARGARRLKSRFGAALEPFTQINLTFYEKENRELVTLSQTEIIKSHFDVAADPECANGLAYIGELLVEFAPPHESDEKLYRMVSACLNAIDESPPDTQLILRYFEVWLLRLAGFLPDFRSCAECRIQLSDQTYLNAEAKPRCSGCSRGTGAVMLDETREAMLASLRQPPGEFAKMSRNLTAPAREQLADVTHRLVVGVLERLPRTSGAWLQPDVFTGKVAAASQNKSS